jgi:exosome complex component RRP40
MTSTTPMNLVLPGDSVELNSTSTDGITLGPNISISQDASKLHPHTSGLFVSTTTAKSSSLFYVDSARGRYIPQTGDLVIGTILGQFGDFYKVSLNETSATVLLNIFQFPNASKKNRPRLRVRDLIYARVAAVESAVEPELSCIDPTTGKEGGFGVLEGGYCFNVSPAYARFLLYESNAPALRKMVEKLQFEIAIGVNGKVWIKSDSAKATMLCAYVVAESEKWKQHEVSQKVEEMIRKFKKL